jgi:hypothetical protein
MADICLGPFIVRAPGQRAVDGLNALGIALEFASAAKSAVSPIYGRDTEKAQFTFGPADFYISARNVPFDVRYHPTFARTVGGELFIPLNEVLLSLYRKYTSARPLRIVLTEMRSELKTREQEPAEEDLCRFLTPKIAGMGFRLGKTYSFGRRLTVEILWFPPQDAAFAKSPLDICIGVMEFNASAQRTLGKGKWREPRRDLLGMVLREELRKEHKGSPIDIFSEMGVQKLFESHSWSSLMLMTAPQAREARLDFLKKHPDLWGDHKALAQALVEAGLYFKSTDVYHIRRSIPKLLGELSRSS